VLPGEVLKKRRGVGRWVDEGGKGREKRSSNRFGLARGRDATLNLFPSSIRSLLSDSQKKSRSESFDCEKTKKRDKKSVGRERSRGRERESEKRGEERDQGEGQKK